ncbi:MAG TPA: DUF6602 domain-containing protein [Planctomycetota bacterium]|nr:DUF6602 domain-containing protein [Planctomycetota bacterium]
MPIRPRLDLRAKFRSVSKALRASFEAESVGGVHRAEKGARREQVLRDFLTRYLPPCYGVGSGEIVDSRGWCSKQIDIVIYDAHHSPLLQDSDASRVFPAESVYAVIAFTPFLSAAELGESVANVTSAKNLARNAIVADHDGHRIYHGPRENPAPFAAIFALGAPDTGKALVPRVAELHRGKVPDAWVDCICVLDQALVYHFLPVEVGRDKLRWAPTSCLEDACLGYYASGQDTLFLFYLFLMHQLNARSLFPPDLLTYADILTGISPQIHGPNIPLRPGEEEDDGP